MPIQSQPKDLATKMTALLTSDYEQFVYLGLCQVMPGSAHEFLQKGTNKPIFGVELLLKHPVDQALYLAWQNEGTAHQFHQENS